MSGDSSVRVVFHLPLPPLGGAGVRAVHALERRAKKAYFAALDAMRTGVVDIDRIAQLRRLASEVRTRRSTEMVAETLEQLMGVMGAVAAGIGGAPLLPELNQPLAELVVGLNSHQLRCRYRRKRSADILRWPLEWLRTRGVTVANGLEIRLVAQA